MPGLDRTGPFGDGPKTGRGLGRCNPDNSYSDFRESGREGPGRRHRFRGARAGDGQGRGLGRGAGRRGRPGRGPGRGRRPGRGLGRPD